jgi:hypothetical protein
MPQDIVEPAALGLSAPKPPTERPSGWGPRVRIESLRPESDRGSGTPLQMYLVYILHSQSTSRFCVCHCGHLIRSFHEHQNGENRSTRNRGPWTMSCYEIFRTRADAMTRKW